MTGTFGFERDPVELRKPWPQRRPCDLGRYLHRNDSKWIPVEASGTGSWLNADRRSATRNCSCLRLCGGLANSNLTPPGPQALTIRGLSQLSEEHHGSVEQLVSRGEFAGERESFPSASGPSACPEPRWRGVQKWPLMLETGSLS